MKELYKQQFDAVHADPALVYRTLNTLRQHSAPRRRWVWKQAAALAAACVLCFALGGTALAAGGTDLYNVMYLAAPELAQKFRPVQQSCESAGIRMEVVSVAASGSQAEICLALQDLSAGALDANTDLNDSYSLLLPKDMAAACHRAGWDEQTRTATYLLHLETLDGSGLPEGKVTFRLKSVSSDKIELNGQPVDLDLASAQRNAATRSQHITSRGGTKLPEEAFEERGGDWYHPVLDAGGQILPEPGEGFVFLGAALQQDGLHIQYRRVKDFDRDPHVLLYLTDAAGQSIGYDYEIGWMDSQYVYAETIFLGVTENDMTQLTLTGDFFTSGTVVEGDWQVTFPLEG